MRFFTYFNKYPQSKKLNNIIKKALIDSKKFEYDEKNPELIISIGGDGTFLHCIRNYFDRLESVAFIGISSGNLGFLCEYKEHEVDEFIDTLLNKTPHYNRRRLLEVVNKDKKTYYLNEARIEKRFNTMVCDIFINDEFFEKFRGNGLNIATPTGSSAYNKSLGGPVIHPRIDCIVMQEIAPINHNVYRSLNSPLVLRDHDVITLKGNFFDCTLGGDVVHEKLDDKEYEIKISLSQKGIILAQYRSKAYYQKLNESFIL